MVTCTTPPFRAAVRLNSGVSAHMAIRTGIGICLQLLGLSCLGIVLWLVGNAAYEIATIPAGQYKDSSLSLPAFVVTVFCGLVLLAVGQRIREVRRPEHPETER